MILNCIGKPCPQPVVLAIRELQKLPAGEVLEVIVDNRAAVENVSRMAANKNCSVELKENGNDTWTLILVPAEGTERIKHTEQPVQAETEAAAYCRAPQASAGPQVVAVGTNEMGQGDAKLGYNLMKAFLYALAQQERLPETILFFNGGAKLTVEGSESLADLKDMEERGVEILTCGTCLDFYGLTDKLAVGKVTNMYTIVEKMTQCGRLIRI